MLFFNWICYVNCLFNDSFVIFILVVVNNVCMVLKFFSVVFLLLFGLYKWGKISDFFLVLNVLL